MKNVARSLHVFAVVTAISSVLSATTGCGGGEASQLPTSTPEEAATSAVQTYDKDGDGAVSPEELRASPSLSEAVSRIDANRDGSLDTSEIAARLREHDSMSDVTGCSLTITSNGAPLNGAEVTFQPAPYMGKGLQSYVGTSEADGDCLLKGTEVEMAGLLPIGFYDVHIVHAASNTDVTLGCEVADDLPTANRITLDVTGNSGPARSRRGR